VRDRARIVCLIVLALMASSCEEITNEEGPGTLRVELSATDSPFLAAGDTLVGDTVQFDVKVYDGQQEISSRDYEFSASPQGGAVEILDTSTGLATFTGVGQSTVRVTVGEPDLGGAVTLRAEMTVVVKQYDVELSLVSTVTGSAVDPGGGLVNDTVRVEATVRKGTEVVPDSGLTVTESTDDQVANTGAGGPDVVSFKGAGDAILTVTFSEPPIPGDLPLTATLDVSVSDFTWDLLVESLVPGSDHLASGDTVITDSVVFRALVVRAGNDTLKNNTSDGTQWISASGGTVVEMKSDSVGAFRATGQDTVYVEFTDLDLPGEPFKLPIRVTTYNTSIGVTTLVPGSDHLATGDTLLSDSVQVTSTVTRASDGAPRASSIAYLESSDSSVVSPRDSTIVRNQALFADTGTATLTARLAQPRLPRAGLQDDLALQISTYVVTADSATSTTPVMGDTVQYYATVIDTRTGSEVGSPVLSFVSSNSTAVRMLSSTTGRALARDTGSAEVNVTLTDPDLPKGTVADTFAVTEISEERFYGIPSTKSGDFQDTIVVAASEVHSFTDSTLIRFPDTAALYVDSINPTRDTLWAVVGAGSSVAQLTFINLVDDLASERDTVTSYWTFSGGGAVDDPFEPNDAFPLADTDTVNLNGKLPFEHFLSFDSPADSNFFWLRLTVTDTLDIRTLTQQDANIDFFICNGDGNDPPEGYSSTFCARPAGSNDAGSDPRVEEELNLVLSPNIHVFKFYCVSGCSSVPVTYKLTIEGSP